MTGRRIRDIFRDPQAEAFATSAAALALVAVAACYVPARRALTADPVTLLR